MIMKSRFSERLISLHVLIFKKMLNHYKQHSFKESSAIFLFDIDFRRLYARTSTTHTAAITRTTAPAAAPWITGSGITRPSDSLLPFVTSLLNVMKLYLQII